MNLGGRIQFRLAEIGKRRGFLFRQVPNLKPSTLSLLITRDSKRCRLDAEIAQALGVRLEWLVSGNLPKLAFADSITNELGRHLIGLVDQGDLVAAAVSLFDNMTHEQRGVASTKIAELANNRS